MEDEKEKTSGETRFIVRETVSDTSVQSFLTGKIKGSDRKSPIMEKTLQWM